MLEGLRNTVRSIFGGGKKGATTQGEDRRQSTRHSTDVHTFVTKVGGGSSARVEAHAGDVSRGGIRLWVRQSFSAGDMLNIEIPQGKTDSTSTALACVIHVRELGQGEWSLGCAFSEELGDEDLVAFGNARLKPSGADKRSWVRFVCDLQAKYGLADEESAEPREAQVTNISSGGIGLLVDEEISNGTLLNLKLRSSKNQQERSLLACVVHVTSHPDSAWVIGCNFIRELESADLKALLG